VTAYAFVTAERAPAFGSWLDAMLATLHDDVPADVPCGACNACCRTFHQLHIRPGEKRARKRLPREYLSAAPGLPPGYLLLGCTQAGACPVLVDGLCTIYQDRPLVCRTYDCRLYAATGVEPDRAEIAAKVRRWSFSYPVPEDRERQDAVLAAVRFIRETPACVPGEAARRQPIRLATLAVVTHELFLPDATLGVRRRPVADHDRVVAVSGANEDLFGDG
jgi:Fe-S-cluster containining protein